MSFSGSRTRRARMPSLVGSGGERTASRTDVGPLCWPQVMLILTKRGVDQLVAALGDEPPDPALLGLPQRTTRTHHHAGLGDVQHGFIPRERCGRRDGVAQQRRQLPR